MSVNVFYAPDGDTDIGPSPIIWSRALWLASEYDPRIGYGIHDDFLNFVGADNVLTTGWAFNDATAGTAAVIAGLGGHLQLDSASATQGQGIQAFHGAGWLKPTADLHIFYETRLKIEDTVGGVQFFAGLSEYDATLFNSNAISADDYVGFYMDDTTQTADAGVLQFKASDGTTPTTDTVDDVATLANGTFVKLGFIIEGASKVHVFVNGSRVGAIDTAGAITDQLISPAFACLSNGTVDPILTVDWVRVFQFRKACDVNFSFANND